MDIKELRNTPEYIEAYADYVKTGNARKVKELIEQRDASPLMTENAQGTVPVPQFVYDIVKTAWDNEEIMSRVRKSYLKGNLKVGFEISGDDAQIHEEGSEEISNEELVLGIVNLVPQSIKKVLQITDEVYDLRGEEFLRYVYDELAYRIAKKEADTLVGIIAASPSTSSDSAPGQPLVNAPTITQSTIAEAIGKLSDEASNPVIIMNKQTWAAFKQVQYAGNYATDIFEGLTVLFNNRMPSYADATTSGDVFRTVYAIVGDLGHGALANYPNGDDIEFKFDNLTLKKSDLIEVLGRRYVGLGVVAPNSFARISKMSA